MAGMVPAMRVTLAREKHTRSHQLFLSCLLVLHTGKRWFIICPVAEHPAAEAPESSPPPPLSSLQPEASPGRSGQNPRSSCPVPRCFSSLPCIIPHPVVLRLPLLNTHNSLARAVCTVKCKELAPHCHPKAKGSLWGYIPPCVGFLPNDTSESSTRLGPAGRLCCTGNTKGLHWCVLKGLCPCSFFQCHLETPNSLPLPTCRDALLVLFVLGWENPL